MGKHKPTENGQPATFEELKRRFATFGDPTAIYHWLPGISRFCMEFLRGCKTQLPDHPEHVGSHLWPSEELPYLPPTLCPKSWKDDARHRAIDASEAMATMRDMLREERGGRPEHALLKAMELGARLTRLGYRADERLAGIEKIKIHKLRAPQTARQEVTKQAILDLYSKLPGNKKTRKVERIARQLKIGTSTVWKHLKGV